MSASGGRSIGSGGRRAPIAGAVLAALPLVLTAGCGGSGGRGPVPVAVPTAPAATGSADAECARLRDRLPVSLDRDVRRRQTEPEAPRTAAWGSPPVILRCGVDRPAELRATSPLVVVDDVGFLQERRGDAVLWTVVDRPVYVEVRVPPAYADQGGFLVQIANAVGATWAAVPVRPPPPSG